MVTIYSTPVSSNGRKVLAVAHHLGVDADVRTVDVYAGEGRSEAYLALNPFGKVPTLVDGELVVFESNAIMLYLAEAHGDGRLYGRDAGERALVAQWLFWESAHWQPAWTAVMTPLAGHRLRPDLFPEPDAPPAWDDRALAPLFDHLERELAERNWLVGDRLTVADLGVAAMMTYARSGGFPFARYPVLTRWYERIEALDAWRATACALWES